MIVNVGAPRGACVVAFDAGTGRELWRAGDWGPSYASPGARGHARPTPGLRVRGRRVDAAQRGLLSIDPTDGAVDFAFSVPQPDL